MKNVPDYWDCDKRQTGSQYIGQKKKKDDHISQNTIFGTLEKHKDQ